MQAEEALARVRFVPTRMLVSLPVSTGTSSIACAGEPGLADPALQQGMQACGDLLTGASPSNPVLPGELHVVLAMMHAPTSSVLPQARTSSHADERVGPGFRQQAGPALTVSPPPMANPG